jgi:hypothetical protein
MISNILIRYNIQSYIYIYTFVSAIVGVCADTIRVDTLPVSAGRFAPGSGRAALCGEVRLGGWVGTFPMDV